LSSVDAVTDIERAIWRKDSPAYEPLNSPATIRETRNIGGAYTTAIDWRRNRGGDLDHIVLMAMLKEPERRYGSSQQMAGDSTVIWTQASHRAPRTHYIPSAK